MNRVAVAILTGLCVSACAHGQVTPRQTRPNEPPRLDAIYLPTPHEVVVAMLELARVGPGDVVYDLGSGDGRIPIAAVKEFGAARGIGIDIDPSRVQEAHENARRAGVRGRVEFRQEDLFTADLHDATVVTLYLSEAINVKLRPTLLAQLEPGSRIVSHFFAMGDWMPDATRVVSDRTIYLWRVPAR